MTQDEIEAYTAAAEKIAGVARGETLRRVGRCDAADKTQGAAAFDPVTEADRAAERAMRAWIAAEYPDHGVAGEEYGATAGAGRWSWSLDPIDGTRAFICGLPSWTTLIALLREGRPLVGAIDAPRLDELHVGWPGGAAQVVAGERRPLRTSGCGDLAAARLSTTDPYLFTGGDGQAFERVRREARVTRFGLDGYGYAVLASGGLDLVIENSLKPHDYNALIPVVRGAGGVIGNWEGEDDFSAGEVVAAATPELFKAAVRLLRG